jgi:hypothetical protein
LPILQSQPIFQQKLSIGWFYLSRKRPSCLLEYVLLRHPARGQFSDGIAYLYGRDLLRVSEYPCRCGVDFIEVAADLSDEFSRVFSACAFECHPELIQGFIRPACFTLSVKRVALGLSETRFHLIDDLVRRRISFC